VNKFLADNNIPSDMVKLREVGKITPVNSGITVNPITAGAEIWVKDATWTPPPPVCTTGFIVKDSSGNYRGLTAGHCQASTHWNDGTQKYYQPYNGRYIGNEIAGTMKSAHSDSLLFTTSETGGFGKIYRYGYSQVTITGKAYTQLVGDTVCFSGTGSASTRCNSVTQVGITVNGIPGQNAAGFTSVGGDSGSPVWNPNGGITVYGTVFAAGGSTSYYSPTGGIEADQGVLQFK
jgi:V8-like Glu-specific endopeptidase